MACATGKTLLSLWSAERLNVKRILVLVPSLALIRQTLHEWLKETEWQRPRFIAVCADPTVTQGMEDARRLNCQAHAVWRRRPKGDAHAYGELTTASEDARHCRAATFTGLMPARLKAVLPYAIH